MPTQSGPLATMPVVLRDKALRSRLIMRLLAIERFFRFLLVGLAAFAVWKFADSQQSLSDLFNQDLTVFRPVAQHWSYDLDNSPVVITVQKAFSFKKSTLDIAAAALALYAVIELIEGVGLWLVKRWGEYFAMVATGLFLPVEVYELTEKLSLFKTATFLLNVAAVVYLLLSKRLFGLRGGRDAYERELSSASLVDFDELPVVGLAPAPGGVLPDPLVQWAPPATEPPDQDQLTVRLHHQGQPAGPGDVAAG
ncbi:MAG TPA: DUF2127 domain-containing protein [Actinocrinis sp.]|nr:DUF2127 domain-containing protein [Actinocrinis sp.]